MNRYRFQLAAFCPVDGALDIYAAEVECAAIIFAEALKALALDVARSEVRRTQEGWTAWLADTLGARVTLRGSHSGVEVESVAECP